MAQIKSIQTDMLKQWMQKQEVELIDVRTVEEYQEMSIPSSTLIPLNELSIDQLKSLDDEDKKIVIHCRSGHRSMLACQLLIDQGIQKDVWNLEGGILDWMNQN